MSENKEKTVSLAIHESLPFPAKYHQVDDESVCTVKQDDLEEFVKYHNSMEGAFKFSKVALVIVAISAVYLSYLTLNSEPEIRYIVPTVEAETPQG